MAALRDRAIVRNRSVIKSVYRCPLLVLIAAQSFAAHGRIEQVAIQLPVI
jgi:hypothetical protein